MSNDGMGKIGFLGWRNGIEDLNWNLMFYKENLKANQLEVKSWIFDGNEQITKLFSLIKGTVFTTNSTHFIFFLYFLVNLTWNPKIYFLEVFQSIYLVND